MELLFEKLISNLLAFLNLSSFGIFCALLSSVGEVLGGGFDGG